MTESVIPARGTQGRVCAYCGKTGTLTREDVFAMFLQRSNPSYQTYLDYHRGLRMQSMPVGRDVCVTCNNDTLSTLDGYVSGLNRDYFSVASPPSATVRFRYDYHRLLRWLLKAWYNDARATPRNVDEHQRFVPYILGEDKEPPSPVTLLVGRLLSFETAPDVGAQGLPKALRFGTTYSPSREVASDLALARMLSLNAYLFHLFVWKLGVPRPRRREHARGLETHWAFRELRAYQSEVVLGESNVDTLHYLNARTTSGGALRRRTQ